MADSEPRQLSRSLNVSTLASKFQQVNTTVHGWQGKPQPVARTESRVSRFSDARAKFQAQAKEKNTSKMCEESRKRSPSPGPKTEALVQNFTQLGFTASKNKPCHGDLKDARSASTWRRSLPDCTSFSTENKENSAQINFCRSNDFLPNRPPSPMHSSFPRPVARVAPVSNEGSEVEGCAQQGARQEPPLPLELFPVGALPRTRDRKDQKPGHGPVAVEAKTVPGVFELTKPDSNGQKQDVHGKSIEAKRSEEQGSPEKKAGDSRRDVEGDAAPGIGETKEKEPIAEMKPACAKISKNEDNIFKQSLSKVASEVKEVYGERDLEKSAPVKGNDDADALDERHYSPSEEAPAVDDIEGKAEKKFCSLQKENRCIQISEKLSVSRANEAADILQIEEVGAKDAVQTPQEGSGLENVAILLAATSDRRRFLDAVGKGGKILASGENIVEEEGTGTEASFTGRRGERLDQEGVVQLDVYDMRTNLRRGRDLDRSTQSQLSNGRRESDACQQPSSLGSSLVGESVGSWLATTSDDLLAINTTKESVVDEKNTSIKESKAKPRVSFSNEVMEILTYSPAEYDRRNRDVDPASAAAEWELEKNVAKLETLQVDLERGCDGLGLAIIGLGTEPVQIGLEKLGIFVRSVTADGVAARDGRMRVGDQIIEVNGQSLVGVTQAYAASVLRAALGTVSFLVGREKGVEVQVEESQATVAPESSALEEEGSVLGLNSSPDLSSFEVEGGISLLADISGSGEGKQVDELESGFIQEDDNVPELGEEQSDKQSMVKIGEESGVVTPREEQEELKEALVIENEEIPRNVEQVAEGKGERMMGEISIASDHEETGVCLERSLAEKYLGLVMELEDAKKQVDSLQQLLKQREEEYRVNLADLTARMSCVKCQEVLRKEGEGAREVTIAHNSFLGIERIRPEVSQTSPLPAFHSTPNPSPSGTSTNVLSRSFGVALGASFFTVPVVEEDERKK